MFQYAVARALADRHHTFVKLELPWSAHTETRPYGLDCFVLDAPFANIMDRLLVLGFQVHDRIWPCTDLAHQKHVTYGSRVFNPAITELPDNVHLCGYFQSEKYFLSARQSIRRDFAFRHALPDNLMALKRQMAEAQSVSLHVRRTDYLSPDNEMYPLPLDYYAAAIDYVDKKLRNPVFYVFSDDPRWVKANVHFNHDHVAVTEFGGSDCQELELMSACKHHVIANSSFSWWGAWLNPSADKIVVAPRVWFNNENEPNCSSRDLVPASWVRI
jgi:hypothetical protein